MIVPAPQAAFIAKTPILYLTLLCLSALCSFKRMDSSDNGVGEFAMKSRICFAMRNPSRYVSARRVPTACLRELLDRLDSALQVTSMSRCSTPALLTMSSSARDEPLRNLKWLDSLGPTMTTYGERSCSIFWL